MKEKTTCYGLYFIGYEKGRRLEFILKVYETLQGAKHSTKIQGSNDYVIKGYTRPFGEQTCLYTLIDGKWIKEEMKGATK